MPKKNKTSAPHTRLLLSGDISAPADVLANSSLTEEQKRETLETWLHELQHSPETEGTQQVLQAVRAALARLS